MKEYFYSDGQLVYCTDGASSRYGLACISFNRLETFIDSSKRSLKCVLLHTRNKYGSIPIGHSVVLKENFSNIEVVLERLKYCDHQRLICVDLKIVNFLLGKQGGRSINIPAFFMLLDCGAHEVHWIRKQSPSRNTMKPGEKYKQPTG